MTVGFLRKTKLQNVPENAKYFPSEGKGHRFESCRVRHSLDRRCIPSLPLRKVAPTTIHVIPNQQRRGQLVVVIQSLGGFMAEGMRSYYADRERFEREAA